MTRRSFLGDFASRYLKSVNSNHLNLKSHMLITSSCVLPYPSSNAQFQARNNFSYAGPRKLDDILKVDQIKNKTKAEISDLWMTYHEGKEKVHGLVLNGETGKTVLARAAQWCVLPSNLNESTHARPSQPHYSVSAIESPFFIHPVFRDGGHFMILSVSRLWRIFCNTTKHALIGVIF